MMMIKEEITFDRAIRWLIVAAVLIGLYVLIDTLSSVLLPFFVAWIVAYMLNPVVEFLQYRLHLQSRMLCVLITFVLLIAIGIGITALYIPPIIAEMEHVRHVAERYLSSGTSNATIPEAVQHFVQRNIDPAVIQRIFAEVNWTAWIEQGLSGLWQVVSQTATWFVGLFASLITLFYLFFILLDYEGVSRGWLRMVPKRYRTFAKTLSDDVVEGMNGYFRGQALVALLVGILFAIGFSIVELPLAVPLGFFIGLLNLVPYLQMIGFIPTILLALLKAADTGENFWIILGLSLLVFAVVQTIQDVYIVPRVMGHVMGLSPTVILLSLSVWGVLLGFIGLIIALPLTTILIAYYKRYIVPEELTRIAVEENDNLPKE